MVKYFLGRQCRFVFPSMLIVDSLALRVPLTAWSIASRLPTWNKDANAALTPLRSPPHPFPFPTGHALHFSLLPRGAETGEVHKGAPGTKRCNPRTPWAWRGTCPQILPVCPSWTRATESEASGLQCKRRPGTEPRGDPSAGRRAQRPEF